MLAPRSAKNWSQIMAHNSWLISVLSITTELLKHFQMGTHLANKQKLSDKRQNPV